MKIVPFILLCVLCVSFGILYTLFYNRTGWQGIVLRGLAILSILMLAVVSANLKELNNALQLFLILAFALIIVQEVTFASNTVDEKSKKFVFAAFSTVSNVLIAVSAITFSQFNVFSVFGGILVGLGLGFIICAVKRYKDKYDVLTECVVYSSIGLFFGFAIMGIINATHLISAIVFLIGGVFMLAQRIVKIIFGEKYKWIGYLTNALYYLSLILVALTIYLF